MAGARRWPPPPRSCGPSRSCSARVDEALRPFGLTFARYEALVLLTFTRSGSLPLGKMGERLMIHPTSVTNIVDRLEAQGLVRRVAHPTDRRTTLCEITDEGREVVRRSHRRRRGHRCRDRGTHRSRVRSLQAPPRQDAAGQRRLHLTSGPGGPAPVVPPASAGRRVPGMDAIYTAAATATGDGRNGHVR